jgi:hypothetical protein
MYYEKERKGGKNMSAVIYILPPGFARDVLSSWKKESEMNISLSLV